MILATCDRTIAAPIEEVWRLLTTADGLTSWMAEHAEVDLRPGGTITWRHENGEIVAGEIREVVPNERLVFTYGWLTGFLPVPPGSTLVTIDLSAIDASTRISVRHSGLTTELAARHTEGWTHFIGRLAERAEGAG